MPIVSRLLVVLGLLPAVAFGPTAALAKGGSDRSCCAASNKHDDDMVANGPDDDVADDSFRAVPGPVPLALRSRLADVRRSLAAADRAASRGSDRRAAESLRFVRRQLGRAHDLASDLVEDERPGGVVSLRAVTAVAHRVATDAADMAADADDRLHDAALVTLETAVEDRHDAGTLLLEVDGAHDDLEEIADEVGEELESLSGLADDDEDFSDALDVVTKTADALGLNLGDGSEDESVDE